MTAWLAVVAPVCVLATCCVDFIALEYGNEFRFVSDKELLVGCIVLWVYALAVDVINFVETLEKVRRGYKSC